MFICTEPGVFFNADLIDEIRIEDAGDGWEIVATKTDGDVVLGVFGSFELANDHCRGMLSDHGLLG